MALGHLFSVQRSVEGEHQGTVAATDVANEALPKENKGVDDVAYGTLPKENQKLSMQPMIATPKNNARVITAAEVLREALPIENGGRVVSQRVLPIRHYQSIFSLR